MGTKIAWKITEFSNLIYNPLWRMIIFVVEFRPEWMNPKNVTTLEKIC